MNDIQELRDQANRASVNLLFTDIEMALTFLDLARTSKNEALRQRRVAEANKAYNFIRDRIYTVELTPAQEIALNKKIALLRLRFDIV